MKEQLISFETAKLAKEKGFDEPTSFIYRECGILMYEQEHKSCNSEHNKEYNYIHTCTQALLQKWIREVHNIDIKIDVNINKHVEYYYFPSIITLAPNKLFIEEKEIQGLYCTYEEALETGLQEALKLI